MRAESETPMRYIWKMAGTRRRAGALAGCLLLLSALLGGCSSTTQSPNDAGDAAATDSTPGADVSSDSNLMCTYGDGGTPDGGRIPCTGGCPAGTVCAVEIGGVAGGGGEYCAPIPTECHGTPTCACMGSCACNSAVGIHPELCSVQNGMINCDNGI